MGSDEINETPSRSRANVPWPPEAEGTTRMNALARGGGLGIKMRHACPATVVISDVTPSLLQLP
jgi:hypothetical protein